jgi:hypothetical protein
VSDVCQRDLAKHVGHERKCMLIWQIPATIKLNNSKHCDVSILCLHYKSKVFWKLIQKFKAAFPWRSDVKICRDALTMA